MNLNMSQRKRGVLFHTNHGCMANQVSSSEKAIHTRMSTKATQSCDRGRPSWEAVAHIEIRVDRRSVTPLDELQSNWLNYLSGCSIIAENAFDQAPASLHYGGSFTIEVANEALTQLRIADGYQMVVYVFVSSEEEAALEELEPADGDQEWTAACENWTLPHASLEGLWESLIFDGNVKQDLFNYATSALLFADKGVSGHLVNLNRMLVAFGPPGTGKTSLCRALAQKLAIRLGARFRSASLLDIHSHSLFSKWFSTSGKLIHRLFDLIKDMAEDEPSRLVCVLVDEIESLASSRSGLGSSGEPTDAVRAVNSLLTSLDRLRSLPNVLVLSTTNISASVDSAFLDRADMKVFVGPPCLEARYEILRSCIQELQRVGIVSSEPKNQLVAFADTENVSPNTMDYRLRSLAENASGLSGRSLRRLPLKAHALFVRLENAPLHAFLDGLERAIQVEQETNANMGRSLTIEKTIFNE